VASGGRTLRHRIAKPLEWEIASISAVSPPDGFVLTCPAGLGKGLPTPAPIARKGNGIQPKGQRDGLLTYRIEFELPETDSIRGVLLDAWGTAYGQRPRHAVTGKSVRSASITCPSAG
jgi:hypothetical protein